MSTPQLVHREPLPDLMDLRARLHRLGFLVDTEADSEPRSPSTEFNDELIAALRAFQASRGLDETGECDTSTWRAILEAEHQFGDRSLYLTSPMLRGEDISALQLRLGTLGFHTGRVDGIFGKDTEAAVCDFQRNVNLVVDGVCGRDTLEAIMRLSSRSTPLSVTGIREREHLRERPSAFEGLRVAIYHTGADATVAGALGADLQAANAVVTVDSDADWSVLAQQANEFGADVCIALDFVETARFEVSYYGTDGAHSVAGRALAETLLRQLPHPPGWGPGVAQQKRLPILRETRCPTVRLSLGPVVELAELHSLLVAGTHRALRLWADGGETSTQPSSVD